MPTDLEQPATEERSPHFILRDAADIRRLMTYLVTHWKPPRVEVHIHNLPEVDSARAQHYLRLYSERCNCLLGEGSAGLTFLIGGYHAWLSSRGDWPNLLPVLTATACVALAGKMIEVGWARTRMTLVLRALQSRLSGPTPGPVTTEPRLAVAQVTNRSARFTEPQRAVKGGRKPRKRSAPKTLPRIPLTNACDVDYLIVHLVTHWKIPRAEIKCDSLPTITAQHAQTRLRRLAAGYSYLPAAVLALLSLLGGFGLLLQPPEEAVLWKMRPEGSSIFTVLVVTLCGVLIGLMSEALWKRLQFLQVLLGLRRHLPKA